MYICMGIKILKLEYVLVKPQSVCGHTLLKYLLYE